MCENAIFFFGGGGSGRKGDSGLGGQGGCEWRSEAFVKIKKNTFFLGGVKGGSGQGGGLGWGVRVDGYGE